MSRLASTSGQSAGSGQATVPAQSAGRGQPAVPCGRWCPVSGDARARPRAVPCHHSNWRRRRSQWARPPAGPRAAATANGRGPRRAARGLRGNSAAAAAPLVPPSGGGGAGPGGAWPHPRHRGAACLPRGLRVPRPALPAPPGADPRGDAAGRDGGDVFTKASVLPQRVAPSRASPSERPGDCSGPGLCPDDREQWVSWEPGGGAGQCSSAAFRGDTRCSGRSHPCTGSRRTARGVGAPEGVDVRVTGDIGVPKPGQQRVTARSRSTESYRRTGMLV